MTLAALDSTAGFTTRAEIFYASTIATGAPGGWVPARDGWCLPLMLAAGPRGGTKRLGETPANVATGPRLILVGDSTMAPAVATAISCANASSRLPASTSRGRALHQSYRAEGLWDTVLQLLNEKGAQKNLVLLQLGHNDQPGKPGRSTDLATEFGPNLTVYVREVKATGRKSSLIAAHTAQLQGWVARQRPAPLGRGRDAGG